MSHKHHSSEFDAALQRLAHEKIAKYKTSTAPMWMFAGGEASMGGGSGDAGSSGVPVHVGNLSDPPTFRCLMCSSTTPHVHQEVPPMPPVMVKAPDPNAPPQGWGRSPPHLAAKYQENLDRLRAAGFVRGDLNPTEAQLALIKHHLKPYQREGEGEIDAIERMGRAQSTVKSVERRWSASGFDILTVSLESGQRIDVPIQRNDTADTPTRIDDPEEYVSEATKLMILKREALIFVRQLAAGRITPDLDAIQRRARELVGEEE